MPRSRTPPEYVLVEGKNDKHVVQNLCKRHGLASIKVREPNEDDDNSETSGIDELLAGLTERLIAPEARTIGVIVDADDDLAAQWQALRARFLDAEYTSIPAEPQWDGWISSEAALPRAGIWIMPDNQLPGMLEDFVRTLIPSGDPLLARAEAVVGEIEREGLRNYPITHRPKAVIHTWLAWQAIPGQPMGLAITTQVLQHDTPSALAFVAWLRRLFDLSLAPEVA